MLSKLYRALPPGDVWVITSGQNLTFGTHGLWLESTKRSHSAHLSPTSAPKKSGRSSVSDRTRRLCAHASHTAHLIRGPSAVVGPSRSTAVPSQTAATDPTQRDRHLQCISEKARIGWQKMSGCNKRSRIETAIGRYKQVIGDGPRLRKDGRRTTEVALAVHVLNRTLELGRPISVRIA